MRRLPSSPQPLAGSRIDLLQKHGGMISHAGFGKHQNPEEQMRFMLEFWAEDEEGFALENLSYEVVFDWSHTAHLNRQDWTRVKILRRIPKISNRFFRWQGPGLLLVFLEGYNDVFAFSCSGEAPWTSISPIRTPEWASKRRYVRPDQQIIDPFTGVLRRVAMNWKGEVFFREDPTPQDR